MNVFPSDVMSALEALSYCSITARGSYTRRIYATAAAKLGEVIHHLAEGEMMTLDSLLAEHAPLADVLARFDRPIRVALLRCCNEWRNLDHEVSSRYVLRSERKGEGGEKKEKKDPNPWEEERGNAFAVSIRMREAGEFLQVFLAAMRKVYPVERKATDHIPHEVHANH
ncbi:MAG: hypothetical protein U0136_10235 [Bdellovibrionota bacterium]